MNEPLSRKGRIQTVLGLIEPDELGPTLMHEHLLIDLVPPRLAEDADHDQTDIDICNCWKINYGQVPSLKNYRLDQKDVAIEELAEFRAAGGAAIVDLTTGGLKPDPEGLAQIACETGVQVVMGCGHYVHEYQDPANAQRSVDDFAREMIGQITEGAWGTAVRAGMIGEIGCQSPWTDQKSALCMARCSRSRNRRGAQPSSGTPRRSAAGARRYDPAFGLSAGARDHQPYRPHDFRRRASAASR